MADKNRGKLPQPHGVCSNMLTEETVKLGGKIWISTTNGTCSYQCIFCDCKFVSAVSFEQHIPTAHNDQRRPVIAQRKPSSPPPPPSARQIQVAQVNVRRESRIDRDKSHAGPNYTNSSVTSHGQAGGYHQSAANSAYRRMSIDASKRRISIDVNRHRFIADAYKHRENKSNGPPPPPPTPLDGHRDRHHHVKAEAKQHKCSRCEAQFGTFDGLREHMRRRHFFRCLHCADDDGNSPKAYETEKGLWSHQRNHHKTIYPYHCDVCVRAFDSRQRRSDHMQLKHVRGKDVKCDFCSKVLMSQFQKKNHIKRNHSDRRYHCQLCNYYRTTDLDNLKRHTKEKHPGQSQP